MKKRNKLDTRIDALSERRNALRSQLFTTTDSTRATASNVQNGFYIAQMLLGFYKNLTNYHLPPKKRIQKVISTLATIVVINMVRKIFIKKKIEN